MSDTVNRVVDDPVSGPADPIDAAFVYSIPMRTRFRGITVREGMLWRGPAGWTEFSPFLDYDPPTCVPWLAAAREAGERAWPTPLRDRIPVNCTVPATDPERAAAIVRALPGYRTAKVKVAEAGQTLADDIARVEAVRDAIGPDGAIRVDANAVWSVDEAVTSIRELERAAGGLEYVEQPCATIDELAAVRRKVDVPIAADESIRRAEDPLRVAVAGAADIAVLKAQPLGGVYRALEVAEACGLPCVVSSAVETSIGMAAGLALAAALPELPYACGLGTIALLERDVVGQPLLPDGGSIPVVRPEPDPELLAACAADEATARRWRERLAAVMVAPSAHA